MANIWLKWNMLDDLWNELFVCVCVKMWWNSVYFTVFSIYHWFEQCKHFRRYGILRERKLKTNTEFRLLLWLPLLVFLLVQFFFSLFLSKIRLIAILHFIPFSYTTRKKVNKENGVKMKIDINWIVLVCGCWNFISPYCIAFVTRDPSGNA